MYEYKTLKLARYAKKLKTPQGETYVFADKLKHELTILGRAGWRLCSLVENLSFLILERDPVSNKTYEYEIVSGVIKTIEWERRMNVLGRAGWRMWKMSYVPVNCTKNPPHILLALFYRLR
jgi:hypothetical protein